MATGTYTETMAINTQSGYILKANTQHSTQVAKPMYTDGSWHA
jgi:hypothetical protein